MERICAKCGKVIRQAAYFCRICQVHFGWDHTNNGNCPRCGRSLIKI